MKTKNNGLLAQGIGLPKFSQTDKVQGVAGLDTQQQGWRIRHPQAMTKPRTIRIYSSITGTLPVIRSYLGVWIGSQRKRPHCAFLGLALSCGYPIRLGLSKPRVISMIYTFLIATNRGRIADFQRIRTISAFAKSETEARQRLAGLPLVFMSRSPAQEVAA